MESVKSIQVRFMLPKHLQQALGGSAGAARLISQQEADKFISALPTLGCEYLGSDIVVSDSAETVLANLKQTFGLSEGHVVPMKLVSGNDNGGPAHG